MYSELSQKVIIIVIISYNRNIKLTNLYSYRYSQHSDCVENPIHNNICFGIKYIF